MGTIAATPLNPVAAADVHTSREATNGESEDIGAFEQALGNEMALMMSDVRPAPVELAVHGLAAIAPETAPQSDGTNILEAILDSASVLPPASGQVSSGAPETFDSRQDAPQLPMHDAAGLLVQASSMREAAQYGASDARLEPELEAPALAPRATTVAPNGAAVAPALVKPAGATLTTAAMLLPTAEAPSAAQKTLSPAGKTSVPEAQALAAVETRDPRDTVAPSAADDRLMPRLAVASERVQTDPLFATPAAERAAPMELTMQARDLTPPLDTLSSATLISKWTPAPHSNDLDTVAAPATARIDTPLGAEAWGDAFRQKIVWLVDRQQQSAELHVNPPHLGPVEVVLNVADDGASIAFCSPHAAVREAIEASLAELRTALAERGLALGEALVSADPGSAREQLRDEAARRAERGAGGAADAVSEGEPQRAPPVRRGLVDVFA